MEKRSFLRILEHMRYFIRIYVILIAFKYYLKRLKKNAPLRHERIKQMDFISYILLSRWYFPYFPWTTKKGAEKRAAAIKIAVNEAVEKNYLALGYDASDAVFWMRSEGIQLTSGVFGFLKYFLKEYGEVKSFILGIATLGIPTLILNWNTAWEWLMNNFPNLM